ncbi:restriction endonuclease subunit S [Streptomyces cyaneofuscatus]|uniref:restriction endonuclease subunit S n=1 Tax=Streptomyces cyaneofuscatus TaxID=66883 RepID=UPI0034393D63
MSAIPLKYVAQINAGQSPPSVEVSPLSSGRPFLQGNAEFQDLHPLPRLECATSPKVANRSDVLLSVRAPVGALNVADRPYGIGRGLCAIAPTACEGRFLWWWLHSQRPQLDAVSTGTTYKSVTSEDVGALRFPEWSLGEQRRIADYLDTETARIDALVNATKSQLDLVLERRDVAFHQSVRQEGGPDLDSLDLSNHGSGWQILALNRVLRQLTNGYVGPTRDLFVDDGVPYLQSLHVKNGRIDFGRRPYFVPPEWAAARPRITLGIEDLLIVQTGAIGEVGIVDEDFVGASCHALLIARTDRNLLLPTYLWRAFRSHWGRHALLREQTGALHPHLEAGNVRFMKLPVPSLDIQERVVACTETIVRNTQVIQAALARRLALQAERRQALITAAVTGQFDVSTASGRGVTDGVQA